jgi:2-keto-4-pentenoate hydratase/2-oxohepta-3-ene-1,7-dioic acid hydratase in catechol pathway
VIATGTPSGVGVGFKPRKFLVAGDVVRIAIEGIGVIENAVVTEPPETIYIG